MKVKGSKLSSVTDSGRWRDILSVVHSVNSGTVNVSQCCGYPGHSGYHHQVKDCGLLCDLDQKEIYSKSEKKSDCSGLVQYALLPFS